MSAEALPFDRGDYEEALVELGMEKLLHLTNAIDGHEPLTGEVVGHSVPRYHDKLTEAFEYETTYRQPVIPDISPAVLANSAPPEYLLAIFGGLATALVKNANEQSPHATIPAFAPGSEQLDDHIHSMWLRRPTNDEAYSFEVYSQGWPRPISLEMIVTPEGPSIDYVSRRSVVILGRRSE